MKLLPATLLFSTPVAVVLTTAGSLGLLGWPGSGEVDLYAEHLTADVPDLARSIVRDACRHTELSRRKAQRGTIQGQTPQTFIRSIAARDHIEIGDVRIRPRTRELARTQTHDVIERAWQVEDAPASGHNISQVGNFLYLIETDDAQSRVTDIRIECAERTAPHERPNGDWRVGATLTTRELHPR